MSRPCLSAGIVFRHDSAFTFAHLVLSYPGSIEVGNEARDPLVPFLQLRGELNALFQLLVKGRLFVFPRSVISIKMPPATRASTHSLRSN
jgi:hypothetical protein